MTNGTDPDFEALLRHLKETRGFDFTAYKRATLMRRVQKRMSDVGVEGFTDYLDYLEVHQDEFLNLFNTILINVTGFFRDPPAWEYLKSEIVPRIIAAGDDNIRVWCAGCASGEEAYTLTMIFAEALGPDELRRRVKIYATDVDDEALAVARQAVYPARHVQSVPEPLRSKYFEAAGDKYAFRKEFRRVVIFGHHDLLQDAPISRINLLASRNTLMYFNADAQARILARFYYALQESGYLFLGKAETLQSRSRLFASVEPKHRVFTKPPVDTEQRERLLSNITNRGAADNGDSDEEHLREVVFKSDANAVLAVNPSLTLVLLTDRAKDLFSLSQRDVGKPLQDLDVSFRPLELRSLISQAVSENRTVAVKDVSFPAPNNKPRWYDVYLMPLAGPKSQALGAKITFIEVTVAHELAEELQKSRSDLETAYEELQSTNEELETTNEELQSTVEELETTNEELQSTNEELETMNEELQSTNEELEAVNDELSKRGEEVHNANAFLEAILSSLHLGVAVVDADLKVQAWNHRAEDLWGARADEVRNTHLLNLDIGLRIETLLQPIRDCLAGRLANHESVVEATNRRGRHIFCHVSLTPMSEAPGVITGVVVLMEEVENGE